ncbi:uncharacterized protein [Rutidosis leptorrhynchoides]|uniref:uncharacterized protein n=1 Tax=Rutidosis leptorrhynchoides TaxID=125765 RepID=UPI003A9A4AFB
MSNEESIKIQKQGNIFSSKLVNHSNEEIENLYSAHISNKLDAENATSKRSKRLNTYYRRRKNTTKFPKFYENNNFLKNMENSSLRYNIGSNNKGGKMDNADELWFNRKSNSSFDKEFKFASKRKDKHQNDIHPKTFKDGVEYASFAETVSKNAGKEDLSKLEYCPPVVMPNGEKIVHLKGEFIAKTCNAYAKSLYVYFVGINMSFTAVNFNLKRMWRVYGIRDISVNTSGYFFFRFNDEEGMQKVFDSGPWLVDNVPLFRKKWEPGLCLEKPEPSTIPLWVSIIDLPVELWNRGNISQIVSCIGKPLVMDKITNERCTNQMGKAGYARVLMEADATNGLPDVVNAVYPTCDGHLGRSINLKIGYQWKPLRCSHCRVFGHVFEKCNNRPLNEEELEARNKKEEELKLKELKKQMEGDEGWKTVGKGNRTIKDIGDAPMVRPAFGGQRQFVNQSWNNQRNQNKEPSNEGGYGNAFKGGNNQNQKKYGGYGKGNDSGKVMEGGNEKGKGIEGGNMKSGIGSNKNFQQKWKKVNGERNTSGSGKEVIDQWQPHEFNYFRTQWIAAGFGDFDKDGMVIDVESDNEGTAQTVNMDDMGSSGLQQEHPIVDINPIVSNVLTKNVPKVVTKVFGNWRWGSNSAYCKGRTRIIVGWDRNEVVCNIIHSSNQIIHCKVHQLSSRKQFFCSFIYASSCYIERRELWKDLCILKSLVGSDSWVILGDFNVALNPEDKSSGTLVVDREMINFRDCVEQIEMDDLNHSGFHFTWVQKPHATGPNKGILTKLDKVMCNNAFISKYPKAFVEFLPNMKSDLCPMLLSIPNMDRKKVKPFRFSNHLASKEEFLPLVTEVWSKSVPGFTMFSVVSKMKEAKKKLRNLNKIKGDVFVNVQKRRQELANIQSKVLKDPQNQDFRNEESKCFKAFKQATVDEEKLLIQKCKVQWLKEGDFNTTYFHRVVNSRVNRSRIEVIQDLQGNRFEGNEIPNQIVKYYEDLLGKS